MNIDKFNSEGYYDPTSYEAMTNVAKADKQSTFRPLVYICSPFSGDTEYNSNQARKDLPSQQRSTVLSSLQMEQLRVAFWNIPEQSRTRMP